jgi:hypothetical protein
MVAYLAKLYLKVALLSQLAATSRDNARFNRVSISLSCKSF